MNNNQGYSNQQHSGQNNQTFQQTSVTQVIGQPNGHKNLGGAINDFGERAQ
jgi:hypothetical protein